MADEADRADELIERRVQEGIERIRHANKAPHLGHCFCGALMGRKYCGPECREEAEWMRTRKVGR